MKLAVVCDDLVQWGGAERVVSAFTEIWPEAPIYTALYEPKKVKAFKNAKVYSSFVQRIPFSTSFYRMTFPLHPLAFESFSFDGYDVVLSSSSRFAHGILTKPGTLHISYCHTPARMFWDADTYFAHERGGAFLKTVLGPLLSYLRVWDRTASSRPDEYMTNSRYVCKRIKKLYGRDAQVFYPFVDEAQFGRDGDAVSLEPPYFLVVSRLLSYKRLDIAVTACSRLSLPLIVIGDGPDRARLQKMAGPTIRFLGRLTDEEVVRYYRGCKAFLFPGEEDFGITPLESMICGKPVIAYRGGGSMESVVTNVTGTFFAPQTAEALMDVLSRFEPSSFDPSVITAHAKQFSKERFKQSVKTFVEHAYDAYVTSHGARKV